jgi:hypothetical protein
MMQTKKEISGLKTTHGLFKCAHVGVGISFGGTGVVLLAKGSLNFLAKILKLRKKIKLIKMSLRE